MPEKLLINNMASVIPIVDIGNIHRFGENITSDDQDCISAAQAIREGLGDVGFLYLTNHGIPEEIVRGLKQLSEIKKHLITKAMSQGQTLFELPESTKLKYKRNASSEQEWANYAGYSPQGSETLHPDSKFEIKETFDWVNNGIGVHMEENVPGFEKTMSDIDMELKQLLKKIFKLLAIGLKLDDVNFFTKTCRYFDQPDEHKGLYMVRLIHYPSISDDEQVKPGTVRCGEHSDYGFLTLLFQDDIGGLEVKTVNGEWVHAKPIPGSIIVNTGDLTEFWTCGIFPATPHRVIIPDVSDSKRRKRRYSIACFTGPDINTIVTPMDIEKRPCELSRLEKNGKVYSKEPVNASDHMLGRVAIQYGQGKPE